MTLPHSEQIETIIGQLQEFSPREVLRWALERFPRTLAFSTSLGVEDQLLTHLLVEELGADAVDVNIFTLDTGRLFEETYRLIEATNARYGIRIKVHFPDAGAVEEMVNRNGVNLFRESVEKRKLCCRVRKVEPLKIALHGYEGWLTGIRRAQSSERSQMRVVEWDPGFGLLKINPLWSVSTESMWASIRSEGIPYSHLHDKGFLSIGCACCTRAVEPGADERSGRWWWEQGGHKECGLHSSTS